jgi:hypothetical protein
MGMIYGRPLSNKKDDDEKSTKRRCPERNIDVEYEKKDRLRFLINQEVKHMFDDVN